MNNFLLAVSIIGIFSLMLLVKKLLGKEGLIGWVGVASVLANLLITKSVVLMGMEATLGNVLFASNFLATDMLTENYGYKEAKKGVLFGVSSVIIFLIISQFALLYVPSSIDIAQDSFITLFSIMPRITLASVCLFALSNFVDIKLYEYLRRKHDGKKMWLRNNVCTILSNGSENFLFYIISFAGVIAMGDIVWMAISATIIEVIIALCDTPFLYLSKHVKEIKDGKRAELETC